MTTRHVEDDLYAGESKTAALPKSHQASSVRVLTLTTVDITISKLLLPLIHALRQRGFVAECACADGLDAEALREQGFVVHPITFKRRVFTPSHIVAFWQVYRLLREGEYDVIHVHTPFAQVIGRSAARLAGVPTIMYTSHGFQFHNSRSRLSRGLIIRIERWLGRWTDVLFTQSREDAESAIRLGIATRERVTWIGNGVQLDSFIPGPIDMSVRAEFDLLPDHKVVGFIGRIVREKGVLDLIDAMSLVVSEDPQSRLLVVGDTLASDGDTAAKRMVREAIRKHGLETVVRFAGMRDDIPRLLRAMDVFTLPSWREGMPRSIIEAMASGLPVVASDIRGCREEVVHGETGLLVPVRRPDRLAQALLTLISNPLQAKEMGARGRFRAIEWFDEREVVQRQLDIYDALVRRSRFQT